MVIKFRAGLVSLVMMLAIPISCNHNIEPVNSKTSLNNLNDTAFLIKSYNFSSYAQEAAKYASENADNKDIKETLLRIESFHRDSKRKVDSLSRTKGINISEERPKDLEKSLRQIKNKKRTLIGKEFVSQTEKQFVDYINYLDAFSKKSESNEISTMAILLLSGMQDELKLLNDVRQKLATP
jgi:predicted outer membrane protein